MRTVLRRPLEGLRTSRLENLEPVAPRDWYLSKVAVVDAHRARGLGRALVEEYLAAGLAAGFRRFRLDVSADNDQAVRIYRSLGFRVEADRAAAGMRYLAMTLDHP